MLTLPDNPTGTLASRELVERVCELADAHDLAIVSDEIYRDLAHDPQSVCSPASVLPERTFLTSGLSKSMALGGWRIGFARLPLDSDLRRSLTGFASEIWSSLAAPMQHVVAYVLGEPAEIRAHIAASRGLHRATTLELHRELVAAPVDCRPPAGGFYLYPDLERLRPQLGALAVGGGAELAELLLERFEIAVLAGEAFGDEPAALRFRIATSLLYGTTDAQRWESPRSGDPTSLPWVRSALDRLRDALGAIASGELAR